MTKFMCNVCGNIFEDRKDAALCCPDVVEVSDDGRTLEEVREDYKEQFGDKFCEHKAHAWYEGWECCWDCGWADGDQEEEAHAL